MSHRLTWVMIGLGLLLTVQPVSAQIVNTLRGFSTDEPGFDGEFGFYLNLSQGNTEYEEYGSSLTFQWRGQHQRVRGMASGRWKTARNEDVADASSVHLRHNWWFAHRWGTIVFVQNQHDRFQRLKSRFLLGGGFRYDLYLAQRFNSFMGVTTMYENEQIEDDTRPSQSHQRLSSFLSFLFDLDEGTTFDLVGFYQPDWSDFADFRSSVQARLKVELVKQLYLDLHFEHRYDSRPPERVKGVDWSLRTGLDLNF